MRSQGIDYEQIYDVLAFRICVNTVSECYEVLGLVHSLFRPIPGRFKDFIAMPKNNNYQSLHTTVIGPQAERIEIQIRTNEMHLVAERGIAAHWQYKESGDEGTVDDKTLDRFNWLRELVSLHQNTSNADEFLENVKSDLFDSEIYVFTPKGDVKELPEHSTPIDFAYSVHTDIGQKVTAARVNGRIVSLKHELQNGDTVEVITSKNQTPNKDWLKYCVTTRAKTKIRSFIKTEQRRRAGELGKEILEKSFRKVGLSLQRQSEKPEFLQFAKDQGCNGLEDLCIKVGYGAITPHDILTHLKIDVSKTEEKEEPANFLAKAFRSAVNRHKKSGSLIRVDGLDDVLVRFGKCCNPIPGDPILGFITRGRGLVIHRADCAKAFELDQDRRIDVEWSTGTKEADLSRTVRLRVLSRDIPGLLKDMSEVFASQGVNILNAQARTTKDLKAVCLFDVTIRDTKHLSEVTAALNRLNGILGVTRITRT